MSRAWLAFLLKRDEKDLVLVLEGLIDSWEEKSPTVRSCKPKKLQVQALWVLPSGPYPGLWVLRQRSLARMLQEDLPQVGAEARRKALEVCPHRRHELPQNSLKLTRGPHNPHCSPLYLSSEHLPAQIFPLQNPTPGGYLRGLPWSRLHTQDPWGSFGSQRQKEAQAGRGVRAKTVGTRRTLGPREGEQRAQGGTTGRPAPGRRCLQLPLPETRLPWQTSADFRRPRPRPGPGGPFPPASGSRQLQDTHSENAGLRLEDPGPRSCAAFLEGDRRMRCCWGAAHSRPRAVPRLARALPPSTSAWGPLGPRSSVVVSVWGARVTVPESPESRLKRQVSKP